MLCAKSGGAWADDVAVCEIRACAPADVDALIELCVEHGRYECAPLAIRPDAEQLRRALFGASPRLEAWIAWADGRALGYATATREFATWRAREYLHMDCLYVREDARGRGIGAALLRMIVAAARRMDITEIEWQTPDWNADAIGFYRHHGAVASAKQRFVLTLR